MKIGKMKIELKEITVRELVEGYKDEGEAGVTGFAGKLDIRPAYQREFIYEGKNEYKRDAVIDTIVKNFPLNVMYWAVREDGGFEIIDGQQRTVSICQFVKGDFSLALFGNDEQRFFHNLEKEEKEIILDYRLMVYHCSGTDGEKLAWFKTINIAGEKLTDQELLNAVYHGPWVADAKRYFSKTECLAYRSGSDYLNGSPIRQDYLETAIDWSTSGDIEDYMARQQNKPNANELWLYFQSVINWVKATFPEYRREMKGIAWGELYNVHKEDELDPAKLEEEVAQFMSDDDVTNKKGIYSYVLNREERHLNIRVFTANQKREAYEKQKGICPDCAEQKRWDIKEMEGDHITPWHLGGKTVADNCQLLCMEHNRRKSGK